MTTSAKSKGQPLVVLATIAALWLGGRMIFWSSPFPQELVGIGASPAIGLGDAKAAQRTSRARPDVDQLSTNGVSRALEPAGQVWRGERAMRDAWGSRPTAMIPKKHVAANGIPVSLVTTPETVTSVSLSGEGRALESGRPSALAPPKDKRWRLDGWLLVRQGTGVSSAAIGNRPASYGASQAGAVLRYRLGGRSSPFIYARASKALVDEGEAEVAIGAGLRPIANVPFVAQAEARLSKVGDRTLVRPAAFVVTEIPPLAITDRIGAEAYVQAGYVGGKFATGFVDGQLRVERKMATVGNTDLRVGAGVWGGAQKGASRLDVGPSAGIGTRIGAVPVRLSVDYRVRLTGDAEPGSGVAVTLSSGF